MVTISTDNITETNEFRTGMDAHWPFLSDAGRIVQKDLDIAEYTDPFHNPMIPHTIVLEPGLVVYKIYNGYWFWGRPTLEDLRQDLRAVTKKCRPGLGHHHARTESRLAARPQGIFLSLRQDVRANSRRTGLVGHGTELPVILPLDPNTDFPYSVSQIWQNQLACSNRSS